MLRPMLSAMQKRPIVLLLVLGLTVVAPYVLAPLLPYDPINSTGPGYLPSMVLGVLSAVAAVILIVWAVRRIFGKGKPEA